MAAGPATTPDEKRGLFHRNDRG